MKLSDEEKKHRREVRKRMDKMQRYIANRDRHIFFADLRRRASSKRRIEKTALLKWCLVSCYEAKIKPNLDEIKRVFSQVDLTPPSTTSSVIRVLRFDERSKSRFTKLTDEALDRAKFHEIKRQEIERLREKTLRSKIRVEVEEEFRDQLRKELGLQVSREVRTIPEDVRFEVWRRDGGKCVKCGSQRGLELDHIIPFSKGGSNTARNIQILCEACNRGKGDSI